MSTHSLHQAIADAKRLESLTGAFELALQQKRAQLHPAIRIPRQRSGDLLVEFVTDYIEHTVLLLESLQQQLGQQDLEATIGPAIQTALTFFATLPLPAHTPLPGTELKLYQLMEQAYLAQRLLEEVNDLCALWRNQPLGNFENTPESLIIHQLIGENRANQLDDIASHLAQEYLPAIRKTGSAEQGANVNDSTQAPVFHSLPPRPTVSIHLAIGPPGSLIKYFWDQ